MSIQRLQRRLGVVAAPARAVKTILLFAVIGILAFAVAYFGRKPDLSHVRAAFLSGEETGNYYAVVHKVAEEAKRRHGRIEIPQETVVGVGLIGMGIVSALTHIIHAGGHAAGDEAGHKAQTASQTA